MTREYSTIFTLLIVAAFLVMGATTAITRINVTGAATTSADTASNHCTFVDRDGDGSSAWECTDGKKVYGKLIDCDDNDPRLGYARGYCTGNKELMTCQDGRVKVTFCESGCVQTGNGVTDVCATPTQYPAGGGY